MSQLFPGAVVEPVELAEAKGTVCIRTAGVSDVENLSVYFTGLSTTSRNKRFMGARTDVALVAAECVAGTGRPGHFTLLAEVRQEGSTPSSAKRTTPMMRLHGMASLPFRSPMRSSARASACR